MFDFGTFDYATFDAGPVAAVVTTQTTASTGGAWYPTPEELARLRAYREELEEAQELPRKKRRKLEKDLGETIRKAYQRAVGQEPEAAEEFIEAVSAVAPDAVKTTGPVDTQLRQAFAPVAFEIDWLQVAGNVGALREALRVMENRAAMQAAQVAIETWRHAETERMRLDEEDIEVLLLGI
jgi:hypothetical protein